MIAIFGTNSERFFDGLKQVQNLHFIQQLSIEKKHKTGQVMAN